MQNGHQRQICKTFIGLSICAKMLGGDIPFYLKIWPKLTHPFKNADFLSMFAGSASAVTPSKKKINTDRKSTRSFPMSLR